MNTCKKCGNRYEGRFCNKCGTKVEIIVPLFEKSSYSNQIPSDSQLNVSKEPNVDIENDFLRRNYSTYSQKVESTKKTSLLKLLIGSVIMIGGFMLFFILLTQILSFTNKSSDTDIDLKEEAMPDHGEIFAKTFADYDAISRLEVKTTGEYAHFIKVYDVSSNIVIIEFFMHPNTTHRVYLPRGYYKIKYASGTKWYGHPNLFGSKTQAAIMNYSFTFTKAEGYTIELFKQPGGNFSETRIDVSDF